MSHCYNVTFWRKKFKNAPQTKIWQFGGKQMWRTVTLKARWQDGIYHGIGPVYIMKRFLPSSDSKAVCRRPWKHDLTPPPPHPPDFIEIGYLKTYCHTFDDQWHITLMFVTCVTHVTSVTPCDTMSTKKIKRKKIQKYDNWETAYMRHNVTLYDTWTPMWHQMSFNLLDH
jgi:hypothetical protein